VFTEPIQGLLVNTGFGGIRRMLVNTGFDDVYRTHSIQGLLVNTEFDGVCRTHLGFVGEHWIWQYFQNPFRVCW
jgi:hypothetical protein